MRTAPINTTMDRDDLLTEEGAAFVRELDALAQELDRRRLPVTTCDALEPVGGATFHDNGKRHLAMPRDPAERYTFGAVFLRQVGRNGGAGRV